MDRMAVLLLALVVAPSPATAQQSRCADCHFAQAPLVRARHVSDWDTSPHGRRRGLRGVPSG